MAISADPPAKNRGHLPEVLDEGEDETLSLCDLPIHGHSADSDEVDRSLSSSPNDQEFFEFSGEDFSFSSHETEKNIIFCGKLIPRREQPIRRKTQNLVTETNSTRNPKKRCVFQTKSNSSSFDKLRFSKKGQGMLESDSAVSVMASSSKTRWYVYMFGLARFPTEMELRDIKERQNRRVPAPMFRSAESCGGMVGGVRSRGKGLWGMIRALGCKSSDHANTMVKASFACI